MTALLCLPFQITATTITPDTWGVFFARLRRRDKTLIRHNQSSRSQIMPIFDTICLPISVLSSDFTLALRDGCAAMSVATEAAGVTVPADLPVKCSWALRDPGSHGSQQHHPWDAGLVSDLMTSNQQSCSLSPKTFLNTTFKKKEKRTEKEERKLLLTFKLNCAFLFSCRLYTANEWTSLWHSATVIVSFSSLAAILLEALIISEEDYNIRKWFSVRDCN